MAALMEVSHQASRLRASPESTLDECPPIIPAPPAPHDSGQSYVVKFSFFCKKMPLALLLALSQTRQMIVFRLKLKARLAQQRVAARKASCHVPPCGFEVQG